MILEDQSKAELRDKLKFARRHVVRKADKSNAILNELLSAPRYKLAKTILMYYPSNDEVDISSLIEIANSSGKSVALPYCINRQGDMEFYYISSENELVNGLFNLKQPNIEKCKRVTDFKDALLLVPGIAFDKQGYRLGYGKGYYDRFMAKYNLKSIGLCFNSLLVDKLPINEYDKKVDYIITDKGMIDINWGGKNG